MQFSITVYAEDMTELQTALMHVSAGLPADIFRTGRRGFRVEAWPDSDRVSDSPPGYPPLAVAAPPAATPPPPIPEPVQADPAAEPKRRTRKAPAAEATPDPLADAPLADAPVSGPAASASDDPLADAPPADDPDPLGLNAPVEDPALTPQQAKTEALDRLRKLFAVANGGAEIVKRTLEAFGAARFGDVPDARGHELLAAALAAEKEMGTP